MDHFTRLATQQLAPVPVLRPALPAHYAPRRVAPLLDADLEPDAGLAAAAPQPMRAAEPAQPPEAGRMMPSRQAASEKPAIAPSALRHAPAMQAHWTSSPASARHDGVAPQGHAAPSSSAPAAPLGRSATAPSGRAGAVLPRARAHGDTVTPAAQPSVDAARPLATPSARHPARAPLSPQRAQALSPQRPPAQADAAPVVHLHVDRIEVRAAAAAAPLAQPARAPRPAPALSLADYLRKGGQR